MSVSLINVVVVTDIIIFITGKLNDRDSVILRFAISVGR